MTDPTMPPVTPPQPQKGSVMPTIIAVILTAIVAGVGGLLVGQNMQPTQETTDTTDTTQNQDTEPENLMEEETPEIQGDNPAEDTYTLCNDGECHFSFEYRDDWGVITVGGERVNTAFFYDADLLPDGYNGTMPNMSISYLEDHTVLNIDGYNPEDGPYVFEPDVFTGNEYPVDGGIFQEFVSGQVGDDDRLSYILFLDQQGQTPAVVIEFMFGEGPFDYGIDSPFVEEMLDSFVAL